MARHDTELAVKYLMIAALSMTCKVGVWHTMKELAGKSLTVEDFSLTLAPFNMTGNVGVCHDTTQNWQVRLLVTANQWSLGGRSGDSFV